VHASIPDKVAAVLDPLGNAVHTVMAANVSAKTVLVTGTGIIGLMSITVAKAAGASRIFATDIDPRRRALAKKLGAVEAFDPRENSWIDEVRRACKGEGADVLLEMSGAESALSQGLGALRNGGTAALLGLFKGPITFDINSLVIFKGATVLGVNGRKMFETWYQMEELLLSGRLELDEIITHEVPLTDFKRGHELMIAGEGIKVVMAVG
jgi:threonine 3-dehydrogenase